MKQLKKMSRSGENVLGMRKIFIYIALFMLAFTTMGPFWFIISVSVGKVYTMGSSLEWIPKNPTFENYAFLFMDTSFLRWFINSTIVSITVTVLTLFTCSLGAYIFARKSFPGRDLLFIVIISSLMIPFAVKLIPLFLLTNKLCLVNTYGGLILPGFANAMVLFFLRQFIIALPSDLEDAARLDGCSEFGIYLRVILPLIRTPLAMMAIITLMFSWNDLLWPVVVTNTEEMQTLTVGIASLQGEFATNYSLAMAGAACSVVPLIIAFLFLRKQFIAAITSGGLKM